MKLTKFSQVGHLMSASEAAIYLNMQTAFGRNDFRCAEYRQKMIRKYANWYKGYDKEDTLFIIAHAYADCRDGIYNNILMKDYKY